MSLYKGVQVKIIAPPPDHEIDAAWAYGTVGNNLKQGYFPAEYIKLKEEDFSHSQQSAIDSSIPFVPTPPVSEDLSHTTMRSDSTVLVYKCAHPACVYLRHKRAAFAGHCWAACRRCNWRELDSIGKEPELMLIASG